MLPRIRSSELLPLHNTCLMSTSLAVDGLSFSWPHYTTGYTGTQAVSAKFVVEYLLYIPTGPALDSPGAGSSSPRVPKKWKRYIYSIPIM